MANNYTTNPMVIDTFTSDLNIGTLAFSLATAPFHIRKLSLHDPLTNDTVVLRDNNDNVVAKLKHAGSQPAGIGIGNTTEETWDIEKDFNPALITQGLKITASDQSIDSGSGVELYIYI